MQYNQLQNWSLWLFLCKPTLEPNQSLHTSTRKVLTLYIYVPNH